VLGAQRRRDGRLVCAALPADDGALHVPIFRTVIYGRSVIGSIVGTRNDLTDAFRSARPGTRTGDR
jgi:propanol-preferring alcohol dehydrogenase